MNRLTINLKKSYDDYYLHNGDTVYTRGLKPKSEYVSPYKENLYHPNTNVSRTQIYDKLGKLEDLEEELGCPLEVVFKAIEDGIVIKGDVNQYGTKTLWLDNKPLEALVVEKRSFEEPRLIKYNVWCFSCDSGSYRGCVSLKDYGKTWWLKEDKSE